MAFHQWTSTKPETTASGTANTPLSSFRSAEERRCTFNCAISWGGVPQADRAEGEPDRGGAFDARPCAHDDLDPAAVRRFTSDWLHQGKERHTPARVYGENRLNFVGQSFWVREYFVLTVGREEEVIRN
jgi:hypothetical protein